MKSNTSDSEAVITIPVQAEVTYQDCKEYANKLSQHIREHLAVEMQKRGINTSIVFADLMTQPLFSDDPNPYKMLMNVLHQFAIVAMGGYMASLDVISCRHEAAKLAAQIEQLR